MTTQTHPAVREPRFATHPTLAPEPPIAGPATTVSPSTTGRVHCPAAACGATAEVLDRWTRPSTSGPVAHARIRCDRGHVMTPPAEWLVSLDHPASASRTGLVA